MNEKLSASVSALSLQETVSSGDSSLNSLGSFDGLGSLTGRAILSLGKLTLKGVEQVIISRRLSSIEMHFPHRDTDTISGLESMYIDLLELSRIHMYSRSTRSQSLQILLRQIARRSTKHLNKALSLWPVVEAELLLSELLSWFDPIRAFQGKEDDFRNKMLSGYRQSLLQWEDHSLAPIVDLLRDFASLAEHGWSILRGCGFLDLILDLYVVDFQDPLALALNFRTNSPAKSSIAASCNSVLMEALEHTHSRIMIEQHPLRGLWPSWPMLKFDEHVQKRGSHRREMWKRVEGKRIQWRISSMYDTLALDWPIQSLPSRVQTTLVAEPFLFDLMTDLLEFSGSSELDEEICFRALRSMHKLWTRIDTQQVNLGLRMYVQEVPNDHAREVFIRIIQRLILLSRRARESVPFFEPCSQNCLLKGGCPLELDGVIHLIHRLTRASEGNESLRQWLAEGEIFRLLDITATRLHSSGALGAAGTYDQDDMGYPVLPRRTSQGPRYRVLVLSMAWDLFHESPGGIALSNTSISDPDDDSSLAWIFIHGLKPLWELELRFSRQHHDDWERTLPDDTRLPHWKDIYSWIK